MKIFICEHAGDTGSGSTRSAATTGFRSDLLRQALLADLSRVPDVQISILRETAAHPAPAASGPGDIPPGITVVPLRAGDAPGVIDACIRDADAVWPLAPETDGMLEWISTRAVRHNKMLLGSSPDAVQIGGSKYRTSQKLLAAGIPTVPTWRAQSRFPAPRDALVVKPDDGAGCADTHLFSQVHAAGEWIAAQAGSNYVLQPYLSGRSCSLSVLCGNDQVLVLGCNDQRVAVSDNQFHYLGSTVNSVDDASGRLAHVARRVIAALPGLWGYVGIDLILTDQGPIVLEVNPRMTMAHAGLHASLGANPAAMLFDMLRSGHCAMPPAQKSRQVSVDVNACQPRASEADVRAV